MGSRPGGAAERPSGLRTGRLANRLAPSRQAPWRIGWHLQQHLQQQRRGETVVFSWLVFRLRAHRDRVNARVIGDPCTAKMMGHDAMPFGPKRMAYGGFQTIVAL